MPLVSSIQRELLEPVLYLVRNGKRGEISVVLDRARQVVRETQRRMRDQNRAPDQDSFELGVASTYAELLLTSEQRATFNDAVSAVQGIKEGVEILLAVGEKSHPEVVGQVALARRLGVDPGNFNRKVQRLVEAGLIDAQREGKLKTYALTTLGEDVLDELYDIGEPMSAIERAFDGEQRPISILHIRGHARDYALGVARADEKVWSHTGRVSGSDQILKAFQPRQALLAI